LFLLQAAFSTSPSNAILAIAMEAVGLPPEEKGLMFAAYRIPDMLRTTINVYGDTCVAVIVAKSEGEKLKV